MRNPHHHHHRVQRHARVKRRVIASRVGRSSRRSLPRGGRRSAFTGIWWPNTAWRNGFHEDGVVSALAVILATETAPSAGTACARRSPTTSSGMWKKDVDPLPLGPRRALQPVRIPWFFRFDLLARTQLFNRITRRDDAQDLLSQAAFAGNAAVPLLESCPNSLPFVRQNK
jgi:hypothetical protein